MLHAPAAIDDAMLCHVMCLPNARSAGDQFDMPQGPAPGEEMKWDLPQDAPSAEAGEASGGLLSSLWELFKDMSE